MDIKKSEVCRDRRMRILSWDVGIHHLSYCILDQDEETKKIKIKNWGIIDLVDEPSQKKNITLIFENIPKKFDEKPELLDGIDRVCIENQPTLRNPTMKTVQIIIYSYFLIRGKTDLKEHPIEQISFISATNKLKVYNGPAIDPDLYTKTGKLKNVPKTTLKLKKNQPLILDYIEKVEEEKKDEKVEEVKVEEEKPVKASSVCYGDKKKLSILYTREMIKQDQPDFLAYFESNQKKDDLADSFLQGYYVLTQKEIQQQQKMKKQEEKKNQPKKPRKSKKKNVLEQLNEEEKVEEVLPKPKAKRTTKKKEIVEETVKKPVTTRGRKKKIEEVKEDDFHYLHDSSDEEK